MANILTVVILGVLFVCCVIVCYKVLTFPDNKDTRNNVVQVKKEMYLAMAEQGKKFETTPVKHLYKSTSKRWIRE
jgi:hypothetical protein